MKQDKRTRAELIKALKAAERENAKMVKRLEQYDRATPLVVDDMSECVVHVKSSFPWEQS